MVGAETEVTTSIRYDPSLLLCASNNVFSGETNSPSTLYMFLYHRDRMQAAAQELSWPATAELLASAKGVTVLKHAIQDHLLQKYENQEHQDPLRVLITRYSSMPNP